VKKRTNNLNDIVKKAYERQMSDKDESLLIKASSCRKIWILFKMRETVKILRIELRIGRVYLFNTKAVG
jgi:hypothetical protein